MSVTVTKDEQTIEVAKDDQTVSVARTENSVAVSAPGPQGASASQVAYVTLTQSGGDITPDLTLGNKFTCSVTQNATLQNPSGSPVDGEMMELRMIQDATGTRTITLSGSKYRVGTDITAVLAGGLANASDYFLFKYHAVDDKWDAVGQLRNYV